MNQQTLLKFACRGRNSGRVALAVMWCVATSTMGVGFEDSVLRYGSGRPGPLSTGLSNMPIGFAWLSEDSKFPDLFVAAGRFSAEPGLYRFSAQGESSQGIPIYGNKEKVSLPGADGVPPAGALVQTADGVVYGYWLKKNGIEITRWDAERREFVSAASRPISTNVFPREPSSIGAWLRDDGGVELVFGVGDGLRFRPPGDAGHRDPDYYPFDGRGIWRGDWPYHTLYAGRLSAPDSIALENVQRVAKDNKQVRLGFMRLTHLRFSVDNPGGVLGGSRFGNLLYFPQTKGSSVLNVDEQVLVQNPDGVAVRHPTISAAPLAMPTRDGLSRDFVAGGEGALYFYRFLRVSDSGVPIYDWPVPLLEADAAIYAGSLPVVNAVDWDGDGLEDLIVGNSEGKILFFKNIGTNAEPTFALAQELEADGVPIHIQTGYWGIQGPGEARWGYAGPSVADWNENGLPDLLLSDATARHTVFLNKGTAEAPTLDRGHPLFWEGIDLYGTWRVRPGVAKLDGTMAYVALDDDDEFHLYWKIDPFNLRDGGKLRLEDGSAIRANFLSAGGTGRAKIVLADWDEDGLVDLIVGTSRHASIPDPETGLPQSKGLPGAAVLWLRNVGTNTEPVFARPLLLHVNGMPVYLGQHECSVDVTQLGGEKPNLIVGDEEGRLRLFKREEIQWMP